jgi:hypothetical protein
MAWVYPAQVVASTVCATAGVTQSPAGPVSVEGAGPATAGVVVGGVEVDVVPPEDGDPTPAGDVAGVDDDPVGAGAGPAVVEVVGSDGVVRMAVGPGTVVDGELSTACPIPKADPAATASNSTAPMPMATGRRYHRRRSGGTGGRAVSSGTGRGRGATDEVGDGGPSIGPVVGGRSGGGEPWSGGTAIGGTIRGGSRGGATACLSTGGGTVGGEGGVGEVSSASSGAYQRPSLASHHPGPCDVALTVWGAPKPCLSPRHPTWAHQPLVEAWRTVDVRVKVD